MADYTFNYTVFSLLTTGRLTSVWIVLETWVLRDGFRCPLPAAMEELFSFCLLPRAQGQGWLGKHSLLLLVTCKDSTCNWGMWLQWGASLTGQGLPPCSCLGTVTPRARDCYSQCCTLWPSFLIWCLVSFHKLLPTHKIGKQLEMVA